MLKVIIGILMLCIIVVVHELGHMLIAKAFHIEVNEFWVGFGPKLFGFEKGGTKYSFRLIPFGGACVFEDMDEAAEEIQEVEYTLKQKKNNVNFANASVWARICTFFAGPLFNFILAFIMGLVVMNYSYIPSSQVSAVTEGSPAMKAGLLEGDTIVKINSSKVYLYPEVSMAIQTGIGKPLDVVYKRGNNKYKTQIVPEMDEEYGRYMIGVSFGGEEDALANGNIVTGSIKYVRYMVKMTYISLKMLFDGQASARDMSGAVGIVSVVSDEYDAAASISPLAVLVSMLNIAVLISANLGVINLLPFPALDGGRLVFAFYEAITGRKVDQRVEGIVNFIGMAFLLLLFAFTMCNDILKLFGL